MKKFKTPTGENNCVEIIKTRNAIIWLGVGMIAMAYFFLIPNANQLQNLQGQVSPTVSLYSNPKSLQEKLPLIDDNHNTVLLSEVANDKWIILYFGYTSCPDVCPIDLAILNQTLGMMKRSDRVQVVFISVDPKRDIGRLTDFTKRFNTDFVGLSAEDKVLSNMTKRLGVYHEVQKIKQKTTNDHKKHKSMEMKTGNNYLVNHTASYLLLNPDLELIGLLTNPHYAKKIAAALDLIIETLD